MRSYRVSKSASTVTATTASVSVSGGSQPELAIEQHQLGSFIGIPTTAHAPESTYIPAAERYAGLRLLAEVSTSHIDPFAALATHQTVTFDDEDQQQSASSLSLSNEPSQATDDANPIMVVTKSHETGVSEDPKRSSGQNVADLNADSTEKRVIFSEDEIRTFKCSYEGCGKAYMTKQNLRRHFVRHTGDSRFRCYSGDCAGVIRYRDSQTLARHIHITHIAERPFECNICSKRFARSDSLFRHRRNVHSVKDEQNQPQNPDSTDKWIIYSGDKTRPFQCGYEGCGKTYKTKQGLQRHFVSHIGGSQFRCYTGDCTGAIRFCDSQALARHIYKKHTMERPFKCNICNKRLVSLHNLTKHRENVHSVKDKQNQT